MSNIVFEAAPRRYVMQTLIRDEWDPERSFNNLSEAVKVAEEWAEATGREHRVIDTQADEPATDEGVVITQARHVELGTGETFDLDTGEITEPVSDPDTSECSCDECAEYEGGCSCDADELASPACDFDGYQEQTRETAIYPCSTVGQALDYLIPALAAEAGEVAGVYAKWLRDLRSPEEVQDALLKECGDVLWMVARIADELDTPLADVAANNLAKLADRQERGVLGGSGDNR